MDLEQRTRNEYFGNYVSKIQKGIEIGPSYRPTFAKSEGWNIATVDHCSKEDLVNKYRAEKIDEKFISNIEEVDFVWTGQTYSELFNGKGKFDYIVASHVIEHAPDLLMFLKETSDLLVNSGYLLLAVPDKKATFDFFRPNSTIGDVIIGHLNPSLYDVKALLDESHLRCELNGAIAWNREVSMNHLNIGQLPIPTNPISAVHENIRKSLLEKDLKPTGYRDAHRWVFTPETLQDIVGVLNSMNLIDYHVVNWSHTGYYEFLMILEKNKNQTPTDESRESALAEFCPSFTESINQNSGMGHSLSRKIQILARIKRKVKNLIHR